MDEIDHIPADPSRNTAVSESQAVVDETEQEQDSPIQYKIASWGADYSVDLMVKRLRSNAFYVPPFQRSYVWSLREASRFIESLLIGLPIPGVFLYQEQEESRHLIVDGQQRLKSLQFFYDGYFHDRKFKLLGVQDPWNNRSYSELDDTDQRRLDDQVIHATIFRQDNPIDDTSIFHVFERLNSGGIRLQPQEVRSSIYYGEFTKLLAEMNEFEEWRQIFGQINKRLKDQELILRFLALYFDGKSYSEPMKDFLNKFMRKHRNISGDLRVEFSKTFQTVISLVLSGLGEKAFRPARTINAAVFDGFTVALAETAVRENLTVDAHKLPLAYEYLLNNKDFESAYVRSTADSQKVRSRIDLSRTAIKNHAIK